MTDEPRRVGRPTKYRPEYCEQVIEWGRQGWSLVEMAAEIGVPRKTLYEWEGRHEEFRDALACARDYAQAWWERAGRTGMMNNTINPQIWSRSMAARFPNDWREKSEVKMSISHEDALEQLE